MFFGNTTIAQRLKVMAALPLLILLCVSLAAGWAMRSGAGMLEQVYDDSATNRNLVKRGGRYVPAAPRARQRSDRPDICASGSLRP